MFVLLIWEQPNVKCQFYYYIIIIIIIIKERALWPLSGLL